MRKADKALTLGSLFDGSGGFPLGGILAGMKPVWASEIEPFPIRVTTRRLPSMKHYGDVSKLNGAELEPVDVITFGSPCTNLSIAGKREGLRGEQSSLFFEAIRIIREMRCATDGKYPRYICWENVPGAFSSNGGLDFKAVLEAVIGIAGPQTEVPPPDKSGWPHADVYLGDGWSVAYRLLDAQYFGVPQRRARIFLVADFAGERAGDVLFKSEGVSGYSPESFEAWKRAARNSESRAGAAGQPVLCLNPQGSSGVDVSEDVTGTLVAQDHGHHPAVLAAGFCTEHSAKSRTIGYEEERSPTLRAGIVPAAVALEHHPMDSRIKIAADNIVQALTNRMGTGGNNVPLVMTPDGPLAYTMKVRCGKKGGGKGALVQEEKSATLATSADQTLFQPQGFDRYNGCLTGDVTQTLNACAGTSGDNTPMVFEQRAFGISSDQSHAMMSDNPRAGIYEAEVSRTLDVQCNHPGCNQGGVCIVEKTWTPQDAHMPVYSATVGSYMTISEEKAQTLMARDYKDPQVVNKPYYIVRRLTPVECARLQGFPDWWCGALGTENPTGEDIRFWSDVWETHRKVAGGSSKPKSEKQIIKWLRNPYSDSAAYKMWGNGVALPCVYFVLSGIAWAAGENGETG